MVHHVFRREYREERSERHCAPQRERRRRRPTRRIWQRRANQRSRVRVRVTQARGRQLNAESIQVRIGVELGQRMQGPDWMEWLRRMCRGSKDSGSLQGTASLAKPVIHRIEDMTRYLHIQDNHAQLEARRTSLLYRMWAEGPATPPTNTTPHHILSHALQVSPAKGRGVGSPSEAEDIVGSPAVAPSAAPTPDTANAANTTNTKTHPHLGSQTRRRPVDGAPTGPGAPKFARPPPSSSCRPFSILTSNTHQTSTRPRFAGPARCPSSSLSSPSPRLPSSTTRSSQAP